MVYRFAKKSDISRIVDLHYSVRGFYSVGFFSKTRKSFLKSYYDVLINDPNEIVFCAIDNDVIRGFCSGSLNVEKQQELFKRKRVKLALSLFSTVFLNPKIIFDVLNRYLSLDKNSKDSFILKKGARSEYWTWEKDANDSEFSVELLNRFYNIFYLCGVKEVFFEVDEINKKIIKIHKLNKAVMVDEFQLPDLRKRLVMKYDLINKFDK